MNDFEILSTIKTKYPDVYDGYYPFPASYHGKKPVKIIILGTDPGNYFKGKTLRFHIVFGLEKQDSLYFRQIAENLYLLKNIELEEVYVQNVCKCYFKLDTGKNKYWNEIARKYWLPILKQELDFLFDTRIPVFITTEKILEVITDQRISASEIYKEKITIQKDDNYLQREIVALYRHPKYSLEFWSEYLNYLREFTASL
jgi:hypothetical protein